MRISFKLLPMLHRWYYETIIAGGCEAAVGFEQWGTFNTYKFWLRVESYDDYIVKFAPLQVLVRTSGVANCLFWFIEGEDMPFFASHVNLANECLVAGAPLTLDYTSLGFGT